MPPARSQRSKQGSSYQSREGRVENLIFYILVAALALAPLPFGGAEFWGVAPFLIAIFCVGAVLGVRGAVNGLAASQAWSYGRWIVLLMLTTLLWIGFQLISLPNEMLTVLSPYAAEQYQDVIGDASAPISLDVGSTQTKLLLTAGYVSLFGLFVLLTTSRSQIRVLCWAIVVSGVAQAVYGTVMVLSGMEMTFFIEKEFYRGFATGTFINRNHLAGFLEMTLSIGIGLMLMEKRLEFKTGNWVSLGRSITGLLLSAKAVLRLGLVVMVVGLVLTRSRMGNAAFFLSLTVTAALVLALGSRGRLASGSGISKTSIAVFFVSIVLVDIVVVSNWFGLEKLAARIEQTTVQNSADRLTVDRYLFPMFKTFMVTGCGSGAFQSVFPGFVTEPGPINDYDWDHAHDDFGEFAVELGLVGFVPLMLAVSASYCAGLYVLKRTRSATARGCAVAGLMGIGSLMMHSTVDFNLQIPSNAMLFVVLLAFPWIGLGIAGDRNSVPST